MKSNKLAFHNGTETIYKLPALTNFHNDVRNIIIPTHNKLLINPELFDSFLRKFGLLSSLFCRFLRRDISPGSQTRMVPLSQIVEPYIFTGLTWIRTAEIRFLSVHPSQVEHSL